MKTIVTRKRMCDNDAFSCLSCAFSLCVSGEKTANDEMTVIGETTEIESGMMKLSFFRREEESRSQ